MGVLQPALTAPGTTRASRASASRAWASSASSIEVQDVLHNKV